MHLSTLFSLLATLLPLVTAAKPSCGSGFTNGETVVGWDDKFAAETAASNACGEELLRTYKGKGDNQLKCVPNGQNSWQFSVTKVSDGSRQLGSTECYYGLVPIISGCGYGGSMTGADGGFHYL